MKANTKQQDKYAKTNRTFPLGNTVLLIFIIAIQIGLILFGVFFQPSPQDRIQQYHVTVTPLSDGSLDIQYDFVWEALDPSEPLTWVEIGMANSAYTVYADSLSPNILFCQKKEEGDYISLRLDFQQSYSGGDVVEFSFKVNQKYMLCKNEQGYFYEFIPCWFNSIQVDQYEFRWSRHGEPDEIFRGSLDYGEYVKMFVQYGQTDFDGCDIVSYEPFDDSGAYDQLQEDKIGVLILCCIAAALLIIAEVYIVDSYVSYGRGRGFLTGYGHHIHTYGRSNPHYTRARARHIANSQRANGARSGGFRSGGCACACACACAGGGRAGCSQKDTFAPAKQTPTL